MFSVQLQRHRNCPPESLSVSCSPLTLLATNSARPLNKRHLNSRKPSRRPKKSNRKYENKPPVDYIWPNVLAGEATDAHVLPDLQMPPGCLPRPFKKQCWGHRSNLACVCACTWALIYILIFIEMWPFVKKVQSVLNTFRGTLSFKASKITMKCSQRNPEDIRTD